MPEYLSYASLSINVVMALALVSMNKQLNNLQISLDLAMELLEATEKRDEQLSRDSF